MQFTRRQLLGAGLGVAAAYALSPLERLAFAEDTPAITAEEVKRLMALPTIEKILEGTDVQYVNDDNFDKVVYQKDSEKKKPVLVLFDSNDDISHNGTGKRLAVVFTGLQQVYGQQLIFACYMTKYGEGWDVIVGDPQSQTGQKLKPNCYNVQTLPSLALYASFDLAKGETPGRNAGRVGQVDILRSGPAKNQDIPKVIDEMKVWWIGPNIFLKDTPDGDGKLYRFLNTGNYVEVQNIKYTPK